MNPTKAKSPKEILEDLHSVCATTLNKSFDGPNADSMAKSFSFAYDLSTWREVLAAQPEHLLFKKASEEYLTALFNLAHGQYRNAYKCLRSVLELSLQGIYLSANLVELQEWLRSAKDTYWSTLVDPDKGPISVRLCNAFFPEIKQHANNFRSMAQELYRELSETVHCNVPYCIPLPDSFDFNEEAFELWHEKADTASLIIHFCLCVRYLKSFDEEKRTKLEDPLCEKLGHIEQVRTFFGGPETA